MTGNCCEAYNILITFTIALSKVQHLVGINVFLETSIKVSPIPKISSSFEHILSTTTPRKPICTWYLTMSAVQLKPATNEKPVQLVKTELPLLMKQGFSSMVDLIALIYFTQPLLYDELYNLIQFVEIACLLKLHQWRP